MLSFSRHTKREQNNGFNEKDENKTKCFCTSEDYAEESIFNFAMKVFQANLIRKQRAC